MQDVLDKLAVGSDRIKKRANKQTVSKEQTRKVQVSVPGTFVEVDIYKTDFGADPSDKGHEVHKIQDPITGKDVKAAFIPSMKRGYFGGSVSGSKKLKLEEGIDNDATALRDGQVGESFSDELGKFEKSLPQVRETAETWAETTAPKPELPKQEDDKDHCRCDSDSDSDKSMVHDPS